MPKMVANPMTAFALTWDGARWPIRSLPSPAQAFLASGTTGAKQPSAKSLSRSFAQEEVKEIRICWVPRLKGGSGVMTDPFATGTGKRLPFMVTRTRHFGDILGVVYRRTT